MNRNKLYYAGLITGLIFLSGDIVGGIITPNYSYISNAVSELLERGANNRLLFSSFYFVHAVFIIIFAIGILINYPKPQFKQIYYGGLMLMIVGICHALSSTFFPMDPIGANTTFSGTLHLILVGASVVAIILMFILIGQGFYKYLGWKNFRVFSFICLPIIIFSGISTPIIINEGIEIMGITERITGYVFYVWLFTLAILLINKSSV